jgi:hypothetical protein
MAATDRTGTRTRNDRPPPKVFLGIGCGCLALNHLSVVLGNGLLPEALVMGCWLVLVGGWVLFAGRTFDAVWAWADPSDRRVIGLMLLTGAAAVGVAEAVAWVGYGRHLFG